eukprot:scaffold98569_cov43-Phaeocystis_antarctica.AAC.1
MGLGTGGMIGEHAGQGKGRWWQSYRARARARARTWARGRARAHPRTSLGLGWSCPMAGEAADPGRTHGTGC